MCTFGISATNFYSTDFHPRKKEMKFNNTKNFTSGGFFEETFKQINE